VSRLSPNLSIDLCSYSQHFCNRCGCSCWVTNFGHGVSDAVPTCSLKLSERALACFAAVWCSSILRTFSGVCRACDLRYQQLHLLRIACTGLYWISGDSSKGMPALPRMHDVYHERLVTPNRNRFSLLPAGRSLDTQSASRCSCSSLQDDVLLLDSHI
jgi:hypothetical protein